MGLRNVMEPSWDGRGNFTEPVASELWSRFPETLRKIAGAEFQAGNVAASIQLDLDTNVVLLAFKEPPKRPRPDTPEITIHTRHAYGNYCYDGTICTYEFRSRVAFLAFDDPTYDCSKEVGLRDAL